jgi:hypothetical protein
MEIDGNKLIDAIVRRLKYEGQGDNLYDSTIRKRIAQLTAFELREIIQFGYVAKWMTEESLYKKNRKT